MSIGGGGLHAGEDPSREEIGLSIVEENPTGTNAVSNFLLQHYPGIYRGDIPVPTHPGELPYAAKILDYVFGRTGDYRINQAPASLVPLCRDGGLPSEFQNSSNYSLALALATKYFPQDDVVDLPSCVEGLPDVCEFNTTQEYLASVYIALLKDGLSHTDIRGELVRITTGKPIELKDGNIRAQTKSFFLQIARPVEGLEPVVADAPLAWLHAMSAIHMTDNRTSRKRTHFIEDVIESYSRRKEGLSDTLLFLGLIGVNPFEIGLSYMDIDARNWILKLSRNSSCSDIPKFFASDDFQERMRTLRDSSLIEFINTDSLFETQNFFASANLEPPSISVGARQDLLGASISLLTPLHVLYEIVPGEYRNRLFGSVPRSVRRYGYIPSTVFGGKIESDFALHYNTTRIGPYSTRIMTTPGSGPSSCGNGCQHCSSSYFCGRSRLTVAGHRGDGHSQSSRDDNRSDKNIHFY